jgi:hypothetical protein
MIFAQTNVEINTKNIINLNADKRVHLNAPSIFLGTYNPDPTKLPQPVLLGNETVNLFLLIQESLTTLATTLASAIGVPEGAPMVNMNAAGKELLNDMERVSDLLEKITSKNVFTI